MDFAPFLSVFEPIDGLAVGVLLLCWLGVSLIVENPPRRWPSTAELMAGYRHAWMDEFAKREVRILDSQIISNLRQGTAFFASASMIAIGGGFALLGNTDQLRGVAQDLTIDAAPELVWEIKLLLMLLFVANAFLKFVWSHRLFAYCAVIMAAVPDDPGSPVAKARARKAGALNVTAARSYNRGLRSVYFGIAASAWLVGALPLLAATLFTLGVILRREFASASRAILIDDSDRD